LDQLTTGGLCNLTPRISPDGEILAFSRGKGTTINLFIMPIGGGTPRQISFFDSLAFYPVWPPGGDELAFSSNQGGPSTAARNSSSLNSGSLWK
jgi:TolB protein